jgi:hypothetical protein
MIFLFFNEFNTFTQIKTTSVLQIDTNKGGEMVSKNYISNKKITVNLDITLERLPCSILNLDVQDILGSHVENVQGTMRKIKLDKNGNNIGHEIFNNLDSIKSSRNLNHELSMDSIRKELQDGEGCQMAGSFSINKVNS